MLPPIDPVTRDRRFRGLIEVAFGVLLIAAGTIVTIVSIKHASGSNHSDGNGYYLIAYGPILAGLGLVGHGGLKVATYQAFVAQRYLLVPHPKVTRGTKIAIAALLAARLGCQIAFALGVGAATYQNPLWDVMRLVELSLVGVIVAGVLVHSRPALYAFCIGVALASGGGTMNQMLSWKWVYTQPFTTPPSWYTTTILILIIGGAILAFLAIFFGMLRAFFTFFTTVPIGGVWIGTMALVCVLSVMSGFESDLREKILGSNAHMQITREEGDFTEWRDIKQKVDKMPGVVASTPYAVSEVVIAANNNGMPVIIKGIDPKTVGAVTDLVADLEDKDAMQRLEPIPDTEHDLRVPQTQKQGPVVDPPPPDMPSSGDPIDYSHATDDDSDAGTDHVRMPAGSALLEPPATIDEPVVHTGSATGKIFGGDATQIVPQKVADDPPPIGSDMLVDPPPPDMLTSDDPPIDYSKPGEGHIDPTIHVVDNLDSPSLNHRTQSLPGILVGKELNKQTHLYQGEEVRVVSPLSDPSNPDATGTPIPFNRDYRVAGVFFTGMYEYDLKFVYVTLDSLQDFLDRGDAIDGIEVRVDDPDRTDTYVEQIGEALGPKYRVQDWKELNRSLFSALKLEKIAMFLVLGIVILVASFSIVGNLIMVVVEKGREIALLKTLGASDGGVMLLFAIQGLFIGIIGTTLGVASGLVTCFVGQRVGIPLNPDVYYIDKMPVHVDPSSVAVTFAAGILISIAATFYPALLAARVRPGVGMRH